MLVKVKRGIYGHNLIENQVFEQIDNKVHNGHRGAFIMVMNRSNSNLPKKLLKVWLASKEDFEVLPEGSTVIPFTNSKKSELFKSDEEIYNEIDTNFELMEKMVTGCATGQIKGIVISGAPGVGKSYEVQRVLEGNGYAQIILEQSAEEISEEEQLALADELNGQKYYVLIKGRITPLGLYTTLYNHRDKIIVFDDCDSVMQEPVSLNLLKAALDSYERRMICWNSRAVGVGIPRKFEFTGTVIFISNIHFDLVKETSKLRSHLDALMSRCHFLDLSMKSNREKIIRLKQVISESDLLYRYDLTEEEKAEIIQFIIDNEEHFREISLRTALKIADIRMIDRKDWQKMAKISCLGGKIQSVE